MSKSSKITICSAFVLGPLIGIVMGVTNVTELKIIYTPYIILVFSAIVLLLLIVLCILLKSNSILIKEFKKNTNEEEIQLVGYFGTLSMKFSMRTIVINTIAVFCIFYFVPIWAIIAREYKLTFLPICFIMALSGCIFYLTINVFELLKRSGLKKLIQTGQ